MVIYNFKRFLSLAIDLLLLGLPSEAISRFFSMSGAPSLVVDISVGFFVFCVVPVVLFKNQTIGMKISGLRFKSIDGEDINTIPLLWRYSIVGLSIPIHYLEIQLNKGSFSILYMPIFLYRSLIFTGVFPLLFYGKRRALWDQLTKVEVVDLKIETNETNFFTWRNFSLVFIIALFCNLLAIFDLLNKPAQHPFPLYLEKSGSPIKVGPK